MRILRNKIPALILIISLLSCNYDNLMPPQQGETWLSGLCVAVPHDDLPYALLLDKGDLIVYSDQPESNVKIGNRYSIYYSLVKPKQQDAIREAKIANMIPVTTIPLTYPDSADSFTGQADPIEIIQPFWLGGNFINVEFKFKMSDSKIKHTLKLLYTAFNEENKELQLDFIHLANGDLPEQELPAIVSFPLNSIQEFNSSDTVLIRVLQENRHGENHYSFYGLKGGWVKD